MLASAFSMAPKLAQRVAHALAAPASVARYDHRTYYSMLLANFMALLLHFSWIFIFRGLGLSTLSLINIGSVTIWILNIAILCRWGAVLTAVVIGSAEVVGHQFLAIYYLGWDYGFQYFLLVIVAFAFMMNFRSLTVPVTMFVVCLLSFLGFYYQVQYWNLPHMDPGATVRETFLMANVTSAFTILAFMSYVYSEAARTAEAKLEIEQQKSEKLLLNILPPSIAARLKEDNSVIADHFESTTVMFSDIVGFTALSELVTPNELVERLNRIFCAFDDLAEKHGLEKIKTIGDAYMVAGGFPEQRDGHAADVCAMALDMLDAIQRCNREAETPVSIRIGIHTGPAVAGVIGIKKFVYDVWGDTVNTASRMESSGLPGRIQLSEHAAARIGTEFVLEERGVVEVKGKGCMKTYWLLGRREES
ncbi:MAG TPA: adenylate/guanylate cyclase domain-containing protein, partial [Lacipirellulaceae bacterium]|nr:adenylate/guanylate cyclase domain-containing protein [Lacipirellulaceae bacterium]